MARLLKVCLIAVSVILLGACSSQYEADLAKNKQWEELGAYHGEQGYRELTEVDIGKRGGYAEIDYEKYRAGYLKGRFDYCAGKQTVGTVINPGYPDDCMDGEGNSSFGLVDRGY
ncbi:hypothetical protein BIZ37_13850 [Photobacterium sp. BZF1]|uniref:DUF2799 domain-containing protein n=1 Tax=Photobacterium sp. BZF1 TaxID=1904457 RepID=UPI0016536E3B|nr:DUF2799 domain-containing protein [Photobacterium sp. BZF1]MBC7003645.1 hypothetical protein [Photobacterium sp. BZF1]